MKCEETAAHLALAGSPSALSNKQETNLNQLISERVTGFVTLFERIYSQTGFKLVDLARKKGQTSMRLTRRKQTGASPLRLCPRAAPWKSFHAAVPS